MAKFYCPAVLFEKYPKAKEHFCTGSSYAVNGFLSTEKGAVTVNKYIVENHPSYSELVNLIEQNTDVEKPIEKVCDHIRNLRYNYHELIARQWGVMEVLKVKNYKDLPPCVVVTINGEDISLTYDSTGKGTRLLRKAEKIRSPLLDQLSELAKNRHSS